jgi:Flp pilus assembly pilin Flp
MKVLNTLWREDKGENMPEYALLLFFISLVAASAMSGVATGVNRICFTASVHMTRTSKSALAGGASVGYTGEAPANSDFNPKDTGQEIKR